MEGTQNPSIEKFKDSAKRFPETPYSFGWLLEVLTKNDEALQRRLSRTSVTLMEIVDIGERNGYLSKVFKVTIQFADKGNSSAVVLKVPHSGTMGDAMTSAIGANAEQTDGYFDVRTVHERECEFYERFGSLGIVPLPRVYAFEKCVPGHCAGAIVMEYLFENGSTIAPCESLNMYQIHNITKILARMHAYSLTMDSTDLLRYELPRSVTDGFTEVNRNGAESALQRKPDYFEYAYKRIKHLLEKPDFVSYAMTALNEDLGLKPVLVHGDLWTNNIFWRKNTDGSCGNEPYAIIDWQLMHAGAVGDDLSVILAWCTEAHVRRELEKSIFDFYVDVLNKYLIESGVKNPFTAEQVRACYRRAFVNTTMQMFTFMPVILASNSQMPGFEDIYEARDELAYLRVKMALEDSIRILEDDMPQWLDPNYTYPGLKL